MIIIPQPLRDALAGTSKLAFSDDLHNYEKVNILGEQVFPAITQGLVAFGISALLSSRLGNSPAKQFTIIGISSLLSLPSTLMAWGGRLIVGGLKELSPVWTLATVKEVSTRLKQIVTRYLVLQLAVGYCCLECSSWDFLQIRHQGLLQPLVGPDRKDSNEYDYNIPRGLIKIFYNE